MYLNFPDYYALIVFNAIEMKPLQNHPTNHNKKQNMIQLHAFDL